jgi:hypothetical protein
MEDASEELTNFASLALHGTYNAVHVTLLLHEMRPTMITTYRALISFHERIISNQASIGGLAIYLDDTETHVMDWKQTCVVLGVLFVFGAMGRALIRKTPL